MSSQISKTDDGILTVQIGGLLTEAEFSATQRSAAEEIDKETEKVRVLVIAKDFQGWKRGDAWGDVSFQDKYDTRIKKMAIVCDDEWKDLVLMFAGQGVRRFPVRHFLPSEVDNARAWLVKIISVD